MKKFNFAALGLTSLLMTLLVTGTAAIAADRSHNGSLYTPAPTNFSTTSKRVGVGFTTAATPFAGNRTGFSGWFELSPTSSLQAVFGIASTSPFQFGVGGYYRARVAGNETAGFHLGGGVNLGTTGTSISVAGVTTSNTDFYIAISPLMGMTFNVPNLSNIFVSLDGGLNFIISGGNFDMTAGNLSPALGLSIHYLL